MKCKIRHADDETHCAAYYLKLVDGRTAVAMKNTDAVFIRRRTGAKDAKPIDQVFDRVSTQFSPKFNFALNTVSLK